MFILKLIFLEDFFSQMEIIQNREHLMDQLATGEISRNRKIRKLPVLVSRNQVSTAQTIWAR